jgi:hypothetical protein
LMCGVPELFFIFCYVGFLHFGQVRLSLDLVIVDEHGDKNVLGLDGIRF